MKRRTWDSKSKAKIVLEGLQGRTVASICNEYGITQSMYYRWRSQAFETTSVSRREDRLANENKHLKQAVGELTLETTLTLLASQMGISRESLSRELSALTAAGCIARAPKSITLLDSNALHIRAALA